MYSRGGKETQQRERVGSAQNRHPGLTEAHSSSQRDRGVTEGAGPYEPLSCYTPPPPPPTPQSEIQAADVTHPPSWLPSGAGGPQGATGSLRDRRN